MANHFVLRSKPTQQGQCLVKGHRLWYAQYGNCQPGHLPLLVVHGGPGFPHDYLEPLAALINHGRSVVFYDQIGCGNSEVPQDSSIYSLSLCRQELDAVRNALDLNGVHLLGHSAGGCTVLDYMLHQPSGVKSIVLASAIASTPQYCREARRLCAALPEPHRTAFKAAEPGSPEYQRAVAAFEFRHCSPFKKAPACLLRSRAKFGRGPYEALWGPNEIVAQGKLRSFNVLERLHEIPVPALLTSGQHDEVTPDCVAALAENLPQASWALFPNCAHMAHLEEPTQYIDVLQRFLRSVETGRG